MLNRASRRNPEDPLRGIREWQDHRYDPGYFTGGRINPLYRSTRRNRFGYVLIVIGGLPLVAFPWLLHSGMPALGTGVITAYSVLLVAAGVRLVRGPKSSGPTDAA